MELKIFQKLKQCSRFFKKQETKIIKKALGYDCSAELESLRGTLKLQQNHVGAYDAWSTYFINKDGSARKLTAWGAEDFSKGTFSELLDSAKNMYSKNDNRILTKENAQQLIEDFENKAASLKNKQ